MVDRIPRTFAGSKTICNLSRIIAVVDMICRTKQLGVSAIQLLRLNIAH